MRHTLVLLAVFSAVTAFASTRTGEALKTSFKMGEFTATVKEGFHFNEKAPNAVVIDSKNIRPAKLTSREATFSGLPVTFGEGRAALYICDDAVTFCETRFVDLKGKGGASVKPPKTVAAPSKSRGKVNKHGFIEDDFNKALEQARKLQQPVLIDFSARWCPSCVRLETEMFNTAEFKKATKNFVKLKIDVDRFENGVIAEKYKVRGIPTMIVVNAEREEIDRIVDYQPISILKPFFETIVSDPTSINELRAKAAEGGQPMIYRLGRRLLSSGQPEDALPYLEQVKPAPPELVLARVKVAEARFVSARDDKGARKNLIRALEDAIKSEPGSTRALNWRTTLVSLLEDADDKRRVRKEGVAAADEMLESSGVLTEALKTDPGGEFVGFEPMMVAMARAELIEVSGAEPDEVVKGWKKAAWTAMDLKIPTSNFGINMRFLNMLINAQMFDDADELSARLMKAAPKDAELQRRRLRVLVEMKRYNEAIVLGRKVVKDSYGRNEFWAAELLAKAYVQANRKREARVFLDKYLSRNEVDWPNMKETRKSMLEMQAKVTPND